MADKDTPKKHGKSGDPREERLKAALKANMARRKAQAKARAVSGEKADKDEG
jgi:hypothetical protein